MTLPTITYRGRTFTVPFRSLFHALSAQEREGLRASIRKFGITHKVIHDEDDGLIDGDHRLQIAVEEGVSVPFELRAGLTYEEKLSLAKSLNEDRRHLTAAARKEANAQAEKLRKARVAEAREQGKSLRTIAKEEGVSHVQVIRDLKEQVVRPVPPDTPVSPAPAPAKVQGADGKAYPAKKTRTGGGGKAKSTSSRTPGKTPLTKRAEATQELLKWAAKRKHFRLEEAVEQCPQAREILNTLRGGRGYSVARITSTSDRYSVRKVATLSLEDEVPESEIPSLISLLKEFYDGAHKGLRMLGETTGWGKKDQSDFLMHAVSSLSQILDATSVKPKKRPE
jgi:ParB-like chromosome segregation protein Spo0J